MKISIGTFSKNHKQNKLISLTYKNKNGSIYCLKLPFKKFILLTFKN